MAKKKKRPIRDAEERELLESRRYGFFWYDWIWRILRPILVFVCSFVIICGLVYTGWQKVDDMFFSPMDSADGQTVAFSVKSGSSLSAVSRNLEEAGLIGSAAYRKAHKKASDSQLVLNLDCVGDGDHIRMFPTKKLKKDRKKLTSLYKACGYFGKKDVLVHEKGFSVYPSDQANFPYGVGICALRKKGKTLYLSRIHTPKDTVLEETNVNILRAALITFITCGAAQ